MTLISNPLSFQDRLDQLHATKLAHARKKVELTGPRDADEQGNVPLPEEVSELVEAMSGSGVLVRDAVLTTFEPVSNHPSGGFFGPRAVGENFRRLLEVQLPRAPRGAPHLHRPDELDGGRVHGQL